MLRWLTASVVVLIVWPCALFAAEPVRIVSWNTKPALYEALDERLADFKALDRDLKPDVLVLIEVAGEHEVRKIVRALGWTKYHAIVTNWASLNDRVHFALEAAVISKTPIVRAVEYDASPDGHHEVFSNDGVVAGIASEVRLSSRGIAGFGDPLGRTDRGTIRVDLANGLTIFPVHLKSNRNGACIDLANAIRTLRRSGLPVPPAAKSFLARGFHRATKERLRNARKRERVMAATVRVANQAITEGRTVVIAGDMNTSFEPGLAGKVVEDCALADFGCAKGPLPSTACAAGDGYDDTLGGILEAGLIGRTKWRVLSRHLPRTYDDLAFADFAIDHIAVPAGVAGRFRAAQRGAKTYGSDHFPIWTSWWR
jgi:endonuclease/exonuclease/phosphatase family metal-dependent hydrolase